MIRCKKVSELLALKNFYDFNLLERIGVWIHMVLCPICGKFNRDIVIMQKMAREYANLDKISTAKLSPKTKDRITRKIKESLEQD